MSDFFGYLMLLSMLGLIIGLINPRLFKSLKLPPKRKTVILIFLPLTLLFACLLSATAPPTKEKLNPKSESDLSSSESNHPLTDAIIPDEQSIVTHYKNKIDSLNQLYNAKDIVFETYEEEVAPLLTSLNESIVSRKRLSADTTNLVNLYNKSENRFNKLKAQYMVYGNGDDVSLRSSAEVFLEQNALDPGSVKIQQAFISAKQKNGWVYYVRYRAKNAFGALILTDVKLLMKYDVESGMFDVLKVY